MCFKQYVKHSFIILLANHTNYDLPRGVSLSINICDMKFILISILFIKILHAKKLRVVENKIEQCCAATLFNVVNNIEQVVEPESSPQSGVTMLNNVQSTDLY